MTGPLEHRHVERPSLLEEVAVALLGAVVAGCKLAAAAWKRLRSSQ